MCGTQIYPGLSTAAKYGLVRSSSLNVLTVMETDPNPTLTDMMMAEGSGRRRVRLLWGRGRNVGERSTQGQILTVILIYIYNIVFASHSWKDHLEPFFPRKWCQQVCDRCDCRATVVTYSRSSSGVNRFLLDPKI